MSIDRFLATSRLFLFVITILLLATGGTAASVDGPDPRYFDYDEILALFDGWEQQYPTIFHRHSIGMTQLGEPIWAARISDHPSVQEPEPSLLLHAAQHSNETNGTNAIIFMMRRLLESYGHDPYYTSLVNDLEIWFIPVVNVDGHRRVFSGSEDWAGWRRTLRDNDHNGIFSSPQDGVDMNRNWDYRWADYDSSFFASRMYKGPYPFSEPEVVALRDFILQEMPVIVVDYHSPGTRTYPNMIFWPWFEREREVAGPDAPHYRAVTQEMARRTLTEVDTVNYNGDWYAYDTLPKEQCWVYRHTGICILLMEISKQFWWEGAIVDTIAARVGRGSFSLMERAQRGPGLTGTVTDAATGSPMVAEVQVLEAHDPKIGPRRTDRNFGRYWRLLNPGAYTVRLLANGYQPVTRNVTVREGSWTTLNIPLKRRTLAR